MGASTGPAGTATGVVEERFGWRADPDPRWDDDRRRVFATVPPGVFDALPQVRGERLTADWWAVTDGDRVVGYGWLDDVWGDAEILLAVEEGARGTGAGAFALARLEAEAAGRGLNYVVNVVRDTHPDHDAVAAWFLAHGFRADDEGRLRKRVGSGVRRAAGGPDEGRRSRYEAEREKAVARRGPDVPEPETPPLGPGAEESGGYVDPEQHRF